MGRGVAEPEGRELFLSPEIFCTLRNHAIKGGLQLPVARNRRGEEADTDYRFKIEWEGHFQRGGKDPPFPCFTGNFPQPGRKVMKKMFFGAAVAIALFSGAMNAAAQEQVYALYVDGLACPFCAYGIEKELTGLDGVQNVEIDINKGVVVVTAAKGVSITEASLRQAVDNAGFSLRKLEGPVSQKSTK